MSKVSSKIFRNALAIDTITTGLVFVLRFLVQVGTLFIVARMLAAEEFGIFAGVASLAVLIGALSSFGFNVVLLQKVSKNANMRKAILSYAIPTTLCAGLAFTVIYVIGIFVTFYDAGIPIILIIAIGTADIVLQPALFLIVAEHHAVGRIAYSQLVAQAPLVLRLVFASVIFICGASDPLFWYSLSYFAASLLAFLLCLVTLSERWPSVSEWRLAHMTDYKKSAGFAIMSMTSLGPLELDKALSLRLLPSVSAGIYNLAVRAAGAMMFPITAMVIAAQPRIFKGYANLRDLYNLITGLFIVSFLYGLLCSVILWLIAPSFPIIFGDTFAGMDDVVRWLCVGVPGMAMRLAAGNVLVALGEPWARVGFEVVGVFILMMIAVIYTLNFDVLGMVFALLVAEWIMASMGVCLVFWALHLDRAGS